MSPSGELDGLQCPICFHAFVDPVLTSDGQTYDRACINGWFAACDARGVAAVSPLTNVELKCRALVPNIQLAKVAVSWRARREEYEALEHDFKALANVAKVLAAHASTVPTSAVPTARKAAAPPVKPEPAAEAQGAGRKPSGRPALKGPAAWRAPDAVRPYWAAATKGDREALAAGALATTAATAPASRSAKRVRWAPGDAADAADAEHALPRYSAALGRVIAPLPVQPGADAITPLALALDSEFPPITV